MDGMTTTRRVLTTAATQVLVARAIAKAEELGVAINVAIFDASLQMAAFVHMHDAHVGAVAIAMDKAWTAAGFGGRATRELAQAMTAMPEITRTAILARPRYTCLTGGIPIRIDGELVGAIGVSGARPDQDEQCAAAGLEAIGAEPVNLA